MRYQLRVLNEASQLIEVAVDADSEAAARGQAAFHGWTVVSLQVDRPMRRAFLPGSGKPFSLLLFSQHLSSLLLAGLTVVEAIEALSETESRPGHEQQVLSEVLGGIRRGLSLSASLELRPDCFPPYYVATVRASEQGGGVAEALARWSAYQEQIEAVRRQLVQTLIYPAVLVVVGLAVCVFLLVYVVPRFAAIYEGRAEDLPWLSMLLVSWGQVASEHGAAVWGGVLLLTLGVVWVARHSASRAWFSRLAWRLPALGDKLRLYQLARFYRTVGMLLRGGLPVADALDLVPGVMSTGLRDRVEETARAIRSGRSIYQAFRNAGLTTPVAERMLQVGQRAGNMDQMMERIAAYYDDENRRLLTAFVKTFEPAVMAVIGLLVGGIVILMYIPIFEIAGSLQS